MGKATEGYFRVRIGKIAREQGFTYRTLFERVKEVDPEGRGLALKSVSAHFTMEWSDRIEGRIAFLYCQALDVGIDALWQLKN
jgi:hypothetical protein